jgi:hypothetical protein
LFYVSISRSVSLALRCGTNALRLINGNYRCQKPPPVRHGTTRWGRAGTARWAARAVPNRAQCLTYSPGMACWAVFRARPTREARPIQRVGPAHGPRGSVTSQREGEGRFVVGQRSGSASSLLAPDLASGGARGWRACPWH